MYDYSNKEKVIGFGEMIFNLDRNGLAECAILFFKLYLLSKENYHNKYMYKYI